MKYTELDTPALLIDKTIMLDNLRFVQDYADRNHVALRPHTKTHKMSRLAKLQEEMGAKGITVAKVGEAVFADARKPAEVLIEIEVGEERSGIILEEDFCQLLDYLKTCSHIHLKGIFSHDGNSYGAASLEEGKMIHLTSQERTLSFARLAKERGFRLQTVSIGSTPSLMHNLPILEGVTEIRPGTYIFMDASQAHNYGSLERNAATVLTTIISRPTPERIITDVGAKGITAQTRSKAAGEN